MLRKAETLKSLDELNMSSRAKTYYLKRFNRSLDEIVFEGRYMSYLHASYPNMAETSRPYIRELIKALDGAGFIRHDLNIASFCIGRLYHIVFEGMINPTVMPSVLYDFFSYADCRVRNEKYESFQNPTDKQLSAVKQALQDRLTEQEYAVIAYRFGLEDRNAHNMEQTGEYLKTTRDSVRQIETKALKKLQHRNTLPALIPSSDKQRAEVTALMSELEEIRENPIFKRTADLMYKLRKISKAPFDCAEEAGAYLSNGMLDFSDIDRLGLSVRAYNCLRRAGVNTVADIVCLPKEDWPKVRNLALSTKKEIEEKVHAIGYTDFNILS